MKNYRVITHVFLLILFLLTACSNENSEQKSAISEDSSENEIATLDSSKVKEEQLAQTSNENKDSDITKNAEDDRMVIYNANLSLQVKDYHQVEATIQSKATELGGYVVGSSIYDSGTEYINGSITVKIPQSHFQSYIKEVEKHSIKIKEKNVTGNDVTEEYVDLESRLKAKEAVEKRLLTLMDQAEKTEDLLKISNDLATVQEEKEQILGRMNYLQNNVDYSTVTIQLEEELVKVDAIKNKESLNTWQKAKSQFVTTINGIISFLSGVAVFTIGLSPIIIPILIVLIIWIFYRKKRKPQE
ncbi:DUF4349 domain-containing protein [Niallia sp. Sow4_A1]|uniref:DUF4349 domain-containing protein n=1 Tax=Niallia hominis TaxID=3133173 RepID=A0ABV1F1A6_9BACI|nr:MULTISPECIES: DUF4349 domain-containing protein [Bacillaceae]MCF2650668.1 DUF4349 domain-containing protein [Niallia circulans]CAI9396121.1 hypothetical protein BACSP_04307 [Bacillus sp. T2.9-1]